MGADRRLRKRDIGAFPFTAESGCAPRIFGSLSSRRRGHPSTKLRAGSAVHNREWQLPEMPKLPKIAEIERQNHSPQRTPRNTEETADIGRGGNSRRKFAQMSADPDIETSGNRVSRDRKGKTRDRKRAKLLIAKEQRSDRKRSNDRKVVVFCDFGRVVVLFISHLKDEI